MKKKAPKIDERFAGGGIEMLRSGNLVQARSALTQDESNAALVTMAAALPEIVAKIEHLVLCIADQIAKASPEDLLKKAWWQLVSAIMDDRDDQPARRDRAMQFLEYTQSVIASIPPERDQIEISEDDFSSLESNVSALFTQININRYFSKMAKEKLDGSEANEAMLDFAHKVEGAWMNVRGVRYAPHEPEALRDFLTPHSDVIEKLFGISASDLVDELNKIHYNLTFPFSNLLLASQALATSSKDGPGETTHNLIPDEIKARVEGELLGFDLFDLEKTTKLPIPLLRELSWGPGEEQDFFSDGSQRGWPLRRWPTMQRPFMALGGSYYCFDVCALFDHFYRVMQRTICRLVPSYKPTWNTKQKQVAESLPVYFFQKLLPGALIYSEHYYRWKTGDTGRPEWHEGDILVIYDGYLFAIEVKAGAFTYTSPNTDLASHISSLQNLLASPSSQANRFIDYLESAPEIAIFDAQHQSVGQLRRSDLKQVIPCAITLDAFTELAARAHHLRKVGIDGGSRPTWTFSLDDLRVYADIFPNALEFLHFARQRMSAAECNLIDLDDEMEHLGLFLARNNYRQYAESLNSEPNTRLYFNGHKGPIDAYYESRMLNESVAPPSQVMPRRIKEIIQILASSSKMGRSEIANYLLDSHYEWRTSVAEAIDQVIESNAVQHAVRPISLPGPHSLSLFVWSPDAPRIPQFAVDTTRATIIAENERQRPAIELEYTGDGTLSAVHWQHVAIIGLSAEALLKAQKEASQITKQRVLRAKSQGKIGPNDRCPCGSFIKYKRCHGR